VFVFVTIGDDLLGAIQKAAQSKMLQLALRSLVIDVGEHAGVVAGCPEGVGSATRASAPWAGSRAR
jgi:hypothetical protein